jgi:threonine aldolase
MPTTQIVDLRSDTLTRPTPAMRDAMSSAVVGDDVFGEDPTVNALQKRMAELFGKERALFVTSGTMGNQLAIHAQTEPGDEVIVEAESHVFHYETAAPAVLSGVQLRSVPGECGILSASHIIGAVRDGAYWNPRSRLVIIENTHNRAGGTVYPVGTMRTISAACRERGLSVHIDGARLWNAHVASGTPLREYAECADSLTVCFSKGMGAPVGSVLLGSDQFITRAHRFRKVLGGGMRQAGILASAALHALDHNIARLADDHRRAVQFARASSAVAHGIVDPASVETNMVLLQASKSGMTSAQLISGLRERGVLVAEGAPGMVRAVFHLDIDDEGLARACAAMVRVVNAGA